MRTAPPGYSGSPHMGPAQAASRAQELALEAPAARGVDDALMLDGVLGKQNPLSALLGLSQTTVSRALNGFPEVREATSARVEAQHEVGRVADLGDVDAKAGLIRVELMRRTDGVDAAQAIAAADAAPTSAGTPARAGPRPTSGTPSSPRTSDPRTGDSAPVPRSASAG